MVTNSAVTPIILTLLCSATHTIRVPIDWTSDSDATNEKQAEVTSAASEAPIPIPVEYFHYPANKPKFAVDVASFHGVRNPEQHYSAYPVRPYTGKSKPILGKHKILNDRNPVYQQLQEFTKINVDDSFVTPSSSDYEVFHPYKSEEPSLQEIYKDPVLDKIRNDIYNSQNRLQSYEKRAGQPNVQKDEYLESPEVTDRKKNPQRNVPVPYEIHRPQRRPVYYRPSTNLNRDHVLNMKFKHPWNQQNAKIRPVHYRPLKNHIYRLRQQHALKYDDEQNEYPQVLKPELYVEVPDGYDIYERGKEKYIALRNNVDESINDAVKQNRPTIHKKLELQNNEDIAGAQITDAEEDEFIPIKNYAQVRKTETLRHLPREAAFADAASFDEVHNAPRLREAVKSTKAQTVYTEEGYEDAAYDHAGEEKHAAENEGHGGQLKEKEISNGKYKVPSLREKYQDASGNEYRDQNLHGQKWENDDEDKINDTEEEEYIDDENEQSIEANIYEDITGDRNNELKEKKANNENDEVENSSKEVEISERSKRENKPVNNSDIIIKNTNQMSAENDVNRRTTNKFLIPFININSTFLTPDQILQTAKAITRPKKDKLSEKYPYYFKNLKSVHKHSPLRYAENLKFIPRKSKGGTEFYDSRSIFECPEVEDEVDVLPEKLKKDGHPDDDKIDESEGSSAEAVQTKGKADFTQLKKKHRLKGLGDKIDCFKAKYFGKNPLDSPFFKEDIISNPEPITAPNFPAYKLLSKGRLRQPSAFHNVFNISDKLKENKKIDVISDLDLTLKSDNQNLQEQFPKNENLERSNGNILVIPQNMSVITSSQDSKQTHVYTDVLSNIKNNQQLPVFKSSFLKTKQLLQNDTNRTLSGDSTTYQNKEDITSSPLIIRKKRATPFIYEPYKIIRDGQIQESKKTTTTSNVSPLIKKLQTNRLLDIVIKPVQEDNNPVKRNVATRTYKDIGRRDRENISKGSAESFEPRIVDVNIDQRRGEPRYEIRIPNHKSEYTPVENKKAMTFRDYETQTNRTINAPETKVAQEIIETTTYRQLIQSRHKLTQKKPSTARPFFDVSQYIPKLEDVHKTSASNTIQKVVKKPVSAVESNKKEEQANKLHHDRENGNDNDENGEEEYEEYDDDDEVTTTTTPKPSFRRRRPRITTTTAIPEDELVYPKLRLITRFNSTPVPITTKKEEPTRKPIKKQEENISIVSPKYREKKKKSSKSTLVTDTKTYGENNENDMMKDEVDAMIGVQHNMEEYTPRYEKEIEGKLMRKESSDSSESEDEDEIDEEESEEDDEDELDDDDHSESEEEYSESEEELKMTTPEPTKQTLVKTTEAPVSTTETNNGKIEFKPIVHRKKIEIHKEIPINKSSPHSTQFKQDFKQVEIIRELPTKSKVHQRIRQKKPPNNKEALELYKDENLAKEINKLDAVEVFKENLDLESGPRHGGNYRSAQLVDQLEGSITTQPIQNINTKAKDAETSQSKNTKLELTEILPARRLRGRNQQIPQLKNSGRRARLELVESADDNAESEKKLHGGNLKSITDKDNGMENRKNARLVEFDEEQDDEKNSSDEIDGGHSKTYNRYRSNGRSLHGGNYRNAKLVDDDIEVRTEKVNDKTLTNSRSKAAVLLNSFAQAVPILNSTPTYILDPSKRMYYYVDE